VLLETILGAATGLIGNVVQGIFNYKTQKIELERDKGKHDHEIAMVKAETEAMIMESKANIAITRAKIEGEVELADADVYKTAQKEGNKNLFGQKWVDKLLSVEGKWKLLTVPVAVIVAFLFGFVDFLKGLIRPTLTIYLTGMSTWITMMAWKIMQAEGVTITVTEATEIFRDVTSIMIYLTVSAVTFYFGDRRMAKTIMQVRAGADKTKIDDDIRIE
jgi:hypothetical protein